jgi:integrase
VVSEPGHNTGVTAPLPWQTVDGLRHFYASVLLDAGESVRALASYLRQADGGVHAAGLHAPHPSEERTKWAIDRVLG